MHIKCKFDTLLPPETLRPHPKNRNKHSRSQIERLAKLFEQHGMRAPIIVSNQSCCIVKGHGACLALEHMKEEKAPVVYQDFETSEQEYAFVQSDNAIGAWSELDLSEIELDLEKMPDLDFELLGIESWEPVDQNAYVNKSDLKQKDYSPIEDVSTILLKQCPNCGHVLK